MATHRVLVTDKLAEEGLEHLRAEPGIEVVVNTKLAQDSAGLRQALESRRWNRHSLGNAAHGRDPGRPATAQGDCASGCRRR